MKRPIRLGLGALQGKLYCKAKAEPDFRFYVLYDNICHADILSHAYKLARVNAGASGADGITFEQIERRDSKRGWLVRDELVTKNYRSDPVRRWPEAPSTGMCCG
ncbi:retron-type reverse transcriptase [Bradyrhizobium sp. USDA 4516]